MILNKKGLGAFAQLAIVALVILIVITIAPAVKAALLDVLNAIF